MSQALGGHRRAAGPGLPALIRPDRRPPGHRGLAAAPIPARRQDRNEIDLWREPLAVGQPLPTLPLAVRGLACLPIDLEATYTEARQRGRIG